MEDSSQFLQWALSTLQHDELPPAAAAYDDNGCSDTLSSIPALGYSGNNSMAPGEPPAREGQRAAATNSWSSADTDSGSGGGGGTASVTAAPRDAWSPSSQQNSVSCATPRSSGANQQVSWDFKSASAQLIKDVQANSAAAAAARAESTGAGGGMPVPQPQMVQNGPPPTGRASAKMSAASSSAALCSQDHIVAERKRREKINQRFIELSAVIPGLKKMDKATILSDATRYVKELQEKLKALQHDGRGMESAVVVKKPRIAIAAPAGDDDEGGEGGAPAPSPSCAPAGAAAATAALLPLHARQLGLRRRPPGTRCRRSRRGSRTATS